MDVDGIVGHWSCIMGGRVGGRVQLRARVRGGRDRVGQKTSVSISKETLKVNIVKRMHNFRRYRMYAWYESLVYKRS